MNTTQHVHTFESISVSCVQFVSDPRVVTRPKGHVAFFTFTVPAFIPLTNLVMCLHIRGAGNPNRLLKEKQPQSHRPAPVFNDV